ncbi:hypothetical protein [Oceanithermus sp.]
MRFGKFLRILLLATLALGLAGLLTACPGVVSFGVMDIHVSPSSTSRCDDGIKVVVEGIQEDWEFGDPLFVDSNTKASGPNWVWVEPGKEGSIMWAVRADTPAAKHPQGKQLTIKAYCMRKNAEPGLSQRTFDLEDYVKVRGGRYVLEFDKAVGDCGGDPDYTVTPPGLHIEDEVVMNNLCNGQ